LSISELIGAATVGRRARSGLHGGVKKKKDVQASSVTEKGKIAQEGHFFGGLLKAEGGLGKKKRPGGTAKSDWEKDRSRRSPTASKSRG